MEWIKVTKDTVLQYGLTILVVDMQDMPCVYWCAKVTSTKNKKTHIRFEGIESVLSIFTHYCIITEPKD